jgi:hypothetical protein
MYNGSELFGEHKEHRQHQENEAHQPFPMKGFF